MKLYFLTTNHYKIAEARDFFSRRGEDAHTRVELCVVPRDVQEILHPDVRVIAQHKAIAAYECIRHPCVVEHGGLFMDALPTLPGGLGKIVWDAVQDRMCGFLRDDDSRGATARSYLGYCDGRRVRVYEGETRGEVTHGARGTYKFGWDPIFAPAGSLETYGEMGPERKRETSPVFRAWTKFLSAEDASFQSLE